MAKVSILMNGYNSQQYLKEAIDSVYAQTFKDWEIIFVDNCSTDNTKKIVDSYNDKIKYYKTIQNIPLGAARNFGVTKCKGKYIAFLDTDDIWLENKLKQQVEEMDKSDEFELCYGGVIYIDKNGQEIGKMLPMAISGNVFAQQLKRYEINMQSVILRNNESIQFNERLRHSPDFDLFMTLASKSKVYIINDFIVKYRKLTRSLTSKNIDVWWSEMKYTLDKIFEANYNLQEKYSKEFKLAYAKVFYYKARYLLSIGKKVEAREELSKVKFVNSVYFMLYAILFFPISLWNLIHKFK